MCAHRLMCAKLYYTAYRKHRYVQDSIHLLRSVLLPHGGGGGKMIYEGNEIIHQDMCMDPAKGAGRKQHVNRQPSW